MEFDKDKNEQLTRAEVTDERLLRLFDRADANQDGTVTKAELASLATREQATNRGGPPGGGPPGFGPGGGPGGGRMGPPPSRPGEILSAMARQNLNLTAQQEEAVGTLQKDVDSRLESILTDEQRKQLKQMRDRGPGGGPPGRGGRPVGGGPPPPPPGGPEF